MDDRQGCASIEVHVINTTLIKSFENWYFLKDLQRKEESKFFVKSRTTLY